MKANYYALRDEDGEINAETIIGSHEIEEMYLSFLDEIYPAIEIGRLKYDVSRVLKEIDPIAYNEGYIDYWASLITDGWEEIDCPY